MILAFKVHMMTMVRRLEVKNVLSKIQMLLEAATITSDQTQILYSSKLITII